MLGTKFPNLKWAEDEKIGGAEKTAKLVNGTVKSPAAPPVPTPLRREEVKIRILNYILIIFRFI